VNASAAAAGALSPLASAQVADSEGRCADTNVIGSIVVSNRSAAIKLKWFLAEGKVGGKTARTCHTSYVK
jgi:hypothetical protein